MTDAEWLVCEDPEPMLEFVRDKTSARKLRLLAAALARPLARYAGAALVERAVLAAESMADGGATPDCVREARAEFVAEYQRLASDLASQSAALELGALL